MDAGTTGITKSVCADARRFLCSEAAVVLKGEPGGDRMQLILRFEWMNDASMGDFTEAPPRSWSVVDLRGGWTNRDASPSV